MIQRRQTLFLLAVALIAVTLFFVPFMTYTRANEEFILSLFPGTNSIAVSSHIYYPFILNILVLILSIITIFLFKNRVLQYKLASGLVLLNVFIMGLFFLLSFITVEVEKTGYSSGAFLPVIGAAFAFLAAHFIKKDEQLVRSADRIR